MTGHGSATAVLIATACISLTAAAPQPFAGTKAGDCREVSGVKLCWCPPGKFRMGSPDSEPSHRPDEAQVEVTLTKGFWTAKYETTQGQWKRVMGKLPGKATAELPEGDDLPVGDVNFAQAWCLAPNSGPL
jgi:formylglycine-generating enzyme required for sulfatase activity